MEISGPSKGGSFFVVLVLGAVNSGESQLRDFERNRCVSVT